MSSMSPHLRTGAQKNSRSHPTMIRSETRYDTMNGGCRICLRGILANLIGFNLQRARLTDASLGSRSLNADWNRPSRVRVVEPQVADCAGRDAGHDARGARHVVRQRRAAAY